MQSKLKGEKNILNNFNHSVILRPSIIFGPEDKFFNQVCLISRIFSRPSFNRWRPNLFSTYLCCRCCKIYCGSFRKEEINNNIYELGGPQTFTFKELMEILLKQIKKKRFLVPIPFSFAKFQAKILQLLPKPLLTTDQVEMLKYDNIVTNKYPTLKDLKINPKTIESVLPSYIWRFRKGGQFA